MQCAFCINFTLLHEKAGADYAVVGHQNPDADGEVLAYRSDDDGENVVVWYKMQFMSFGKNPMTGWLRSDEVTLLPREARFPTGGRVSSDPPAITLLDTPAQKAKRRL